MSGRRGIEEARDKGKEEDDDEGWKKGVQRKRRIKREEGRAGREMRHRGRGNKGKEEDDDREERGTFKGRDRDERGRGDVEEAEGIRYRGNAG